MTDDTRANLDPRFDPAFQRGFEGTVTTSRRRPLAGSPTVLPAQIPPTPQPARPVAPSYATPGPEVPVADAPVVSEDAIAEEPTRGANPFIIVLWVIAAVLVGAGGYLVQWVAATLQGGNLTSDVDYITTQIVMTGAPLLVVLGLATAIGLLFVQAIAWRKRRQ